MEIYPVIIVLLSNEIVCLHVSHKLLSTIIVIMFRFPYYFPWADNLNLKIQLNKRFQYPHLK